MKKAEFKGKYPKTEEQAASQCRQSGNPACLATWKLLYQTQLRLKESYRELCTSVLNDAQISQCTGSCLQNALQLTDNAIDKTHKVRAEIVDLKSRLLRGRLENLRAVKALLAQKTAANERAPYCWVLISKIGDLLVPSAYALSETDCGVHQYLDGDRCVNNPALPPAPPQINAGLMSDPMNAGSMGNRCLGGAVPFHGRCPEGVKDDGIETKPPVDLNGTVEEQKGGIPKAVLAESLKSLKQPDRELQALRNVNAGREISPNDLSSLRPQIAEPLNAATQAQNGAAELADKKKTLDQDLVRLAAKRDQLQKSVDQLAGVPNGSSPSGASRMPSGAETPPSSPGGEASPAAGEAPGLSGGTRQASTATARNRAASGIIRPLFGAAVARSLNGSASGTAMGDNLSTKEDSSPTSHSGISQTSGAPPEANRASSGGWRGDGGSSRGEKPSEENTTKAGGTTNSGDDIPTSLGLLESIRKRLANDPPDDKGSPMAGGGSGGAVASILRDVSAFQGGNLNLTEKSEAALREESKLAPEGAASESADLFVRVHAAHERLARAGTVGPKI